jgi:hypothetical protein
MIVSTNKIIIDPSSTADFAAAVANSQVETGELWNVADQLRVIIGADPIIGNPYYIRQEEDRFPFQHIELLTEFSPRTEEVFGLTMRTQNDTFNAFIQVDHAANTPVRYAYEPGGFEHALTFENGTSATVSYHVTVDDVSAQSGVLRILVGNTAVLDNTTPVTSPVLTFSVTNDGEVLCTNMATTDQKVMLAIQKTVVDFNA